ncbi:MAG: heme exporter protein CcmB [Flavobacteriales bacterium]|nr:heme exporter protein CcmB [Flavobacteriales bacterium]MCZ2340047.1 heme exporter protein CcmB [Chitinophagales bacterium]MCZ2442443.1 heme exporter protein CcmB [Flavobacteriales bacterium]
MNSSHTIQGFSTQVYMLLWKEIKIEFRNRNTLNSILLYVFSTVFICYQSFSVIPEVTVWNALLWIIILFSSVNAVSKSFQSEPPARHYYYYQLVDPTALVISKILYNAILLLLLSALSFGIYSIVLGSHIPISQLAAFMLVLSIGSIGISSLLTMVSAIASRTGNAIGMISVLGFPIMIPLLITIIKASKLIADGISWNQYAKYVYAIGGIDMMIIALSVILFPYLWRE